VRQNSFSIMSEYVHIWGFKKLRRLSEMKASLDPKTPEYWYQYFRFVLALLEEIRKRR
jgi:hypothetical protein